MNFMVEAPCTWSWIKRQNEPLSRLRGIAQTHPILAFWQFKIRWVLLSNTKNSFEQAISQVLFTGSNAWNSVQSKTCFWIYCFEEKTLWIKARRNPLLLLNPDSWKDGDESLRNLKMMLSRTNLSNEAGQRTRTKPRSLWMGALPATWLWS